MDAREPTANNTDLWACYLREQWRLWFDPFHLADEATVDAATRPLAETAAANVAGLIAWLWSQPIDRLYAANAPQVTHTLRSTAVDVEPIDIPAEYAASVTQDTQREWTPAAAHYAWSDVVTVG
jgi:hypothetical protein